MVRTQASLPHAPAATPPGLTVAAVARRLGVAPATLRTWDRRYGLGPSEHTVGSHRRYSATDVARLDLMRRLVNTGVPPGDSARAAIAAEVAAPSGPGLDLLLDLEAGSAEPAEAAPADALEGDVDEDFDLAPEGSGSGGTVVAMPGSVPSIRGLARVASSLDSTACTEIVRESLDRRGVVWTWDHLLVPVLVGVGKRWADTGRGIEVEHVLSESVIAALSGVTARLRHPVNPRPVLLACAPEELHSLPLFAVAAGLAERRISARVLGARVPHEALVAAIRRTGPAAVLVWSYAESTGRAAQLSDLPTLRPAPSVIAAGPGWTGSLPDGVAFVGDLVEAVTKIAHVAAG